MSVLYVHNILWSQYKGSIFSALHQNAGSQGLKVSFVQIAATSGHRKSLGPVDYSFHNYPYQLLFDCAYEDTTAFQRALKLVATLVRENPRIVVLPGYDDPAAWALWAACLLSRKTRIIAFESTRNDHPRHQLKEWIKRLFVSRCNAGFCYGKRSAEYLAELGMNPEVIFEPVQAVSNSRLLALAEQHQAHPPNQDAELSPHAYFLFVGRLAPEKGIGVLLRAFARFVETNRHYKLCLVGEGPEKSGLSALVVELGLVGSVVFAGAKPADELIPYYLNAYALVLPSLSEPWGLVVNEAFLMQCPALVSDRCGCIPELIVEGDTGYQFEANSIESLHSRMHCIAADAGRRQHMGERCKSLIEQFTPEAAATQMMIGFNAL